MGLEVLHVLGLDVADARHGDSLLIQRHAEGDVGGQDDLVPGVDTVHVGGGVGLGVAQLLGLLQHVGVIQAEAGHVIEDVIAGAVHDAADLVDLLDPAGALQLRQPADAAADRGGAAEGNALLLHQRQQLVIEGADQGFVGSDDVLAGLDGGTDKLVGGMQAAHSLHNGVNGLVLNDQLDILDGLRVGQVDVLQAQHLDDLHILPTLGDLVNTAAHNAETQ